MDKKAVVPIGQTVSPKSQCGGCSSEKLVIGDHIWATKRYMSPNGILRLDIEKARVVNSDGRPHYECVRNGELTYYLRCPKFDQANTAAQCNDVLEFCQTNHLEGKNVVVIVDNANGCGPSGLVASYYYGKVFEEAKLVSLTVCSNDALWSSYNPVERNHANTTREAAGRQYGIDNNSCGEEGVKMVDDAMHRWANDVPGEHGGGTVPMLRPLSPRHRTWMSCGCAVRAIGA